MTLSYQTDIDLALPDSDGKPMADNTEQFRWIVLIKENLEIQFANDPNVFVGWRFVLVSYQVSDCPTCCP
jgi:hypothetical protein